MAIPRGSSRWRSSAGATRERPVSEAERFEAMLVAAFRRSDALSSLLDPGALLERPIALPPPFLFYVGHLPAFAWNQIGRGALGQGRLHPEFDILVERGIDAA